MPVAFVICTIVSCVFLLIGATSWRSKEAVGFFTGVKPPEVKDIKAYNHTVAKIWFVFAVLLEIMCIPFLFAEQNSPVMLVVMIAPMLLVIGAMVSYVLVEKKYRA